jgi:type IV secretion system protein VirD4
VADLWKEMKDYNHTGTGPHPVVAQAGQDMLDRAAEEAGSVLSTVKSYFGLYRDKTVAANVEVSDFRIRDLMNSEQALSLYIVTQPNDKSRLRPLVRVCVNMIIRLLADKMDFEKGRPKAHYKHRLLMMLDEFPSLGRLDIVQESLAFVAGYGIKCYLITQDLSQLKSSESGYGQDESITSNCHLQNAYPPNRLETAERISELTGKMTVVKKQENHDGSGLFAKKSWSIQEVERPLLTPDECLRMAGPVKSNTGDIIESGDMVVFCAGFPAIYGKQILYFKDTEFLAKAMIPAPQETGKKS